MYPYMSPAISRWRSSSNDVLANPPATIESVLVYCPCTANREGRDFSSKLCRYPASAPSEVPSLGFDWTIGVRSHGDLSSSDAASAGDAARAAKASNRQSIAALAASP